MMRLSQLLALTMIGYLGLMWTLHVTVRPVDGYGLSTSLLMTAVVAIMIGLVLFARGSTAAPVLMFVLVAWVYSAPRFLFILASPDSFSWGMIRPLTESDLNRTLIFLAVGVLMMGAGLFLSGGSRAGNRSSVHSRGLVAAARIPPAAAALVFVLLCSIQFAMYWNWGWGRFFAMVGGEMSPINNPVVRYISTLVVAASDIAFFVYLVVALENRKHAGRFNRWLFGFAFLYYVFFRLMIGSKAGLYYPLLYLLIYKVAADGDFSIDLRRTAMLVLPIFALAFITFYAGLITRAVLMYGHLGQRLSLSDVASLKDFRDNEIFQKMEVSFKPSDMIVRASRRITFLDSLALMIGDRKGLEKRYVTVPGVFKATLDLLLPGRYFPDAYPTSRLWQVIYADAPYEILQLIYHTPIMSLWGMAYLHWGYLGGIIGLGFIGLAVGIAFRHVEKSRSGYRVFWQCFLLYQLYIWVTAMGIEENLLLFFLTAVHGIIVLGIIQWIVWPIARAMAVGAVGAQLRHLRT